MTRKAAERVVIDDPSLSEFQKILLTTDGTVTQLLEIHTGEKIRVVKLEHAVVEGGPHWLQVPPSEPVLSRRILLRGQTRAWLYADSWLVLSRLPAGMQETLLHTDTPIGQLWRAARMMASMWSRYFCSARRPDAVSLYSVRGVRPANVFTQER